MMLFPAVLMNFPNSEVCLIGDLSNFNALQNKTEQNSENTRLF